MYIHTLDRIQALSHWGLLSNLTYYKFIHYQPTLLRQTTQNGDGTIDQQSDTQPSSRAATTNISVGRALSHVPGIIDAKSNFPHLSQMYVTHLLRNTNSNYYLSGELFFPIMIRSLNFKPTGFSGSSFEQAFKENFISTFINVMTQNSLLDESWKTLTYKNRVEVITNATRRYFDVASNLFIIVFILQEIEIYAKNNTFNSEGNDLVTELVGEKRFKDILRYARTNIKDKPVPPKLVDEVRRTYGYRNLKVSNDENILYSFSPTFKYEVQAKDSNGKDTIAETIIRFPYESTLPEIESYIQYLVDELNSDELQKIAQNLNIIYDRRWRLTSFDRVPNSMPAPNLEYIIKWLNTPLVISSIDSLKCSHSIESLSGAISLQSPGDKILPINFLDAFVEILNPKKGEVRYLGGLYVPSPLFNEKCDSSNLPPFHTKVWKYGTGLSQLVKPVEQIATQSRYIVDVVKSNTQKQTPDVKSPTKRPGSQVEFTSKDGTAFVAKFEQINDHLYMHKTTDVSNLVYLMNNHINYLFDIKIMRDYYIKVDAARIE